MQTTKQGLAAMLAETDAAGALRETSTDALLTTFAALTHRIHAADKRALHGPERLARAADHTASDLRAQRDLVRAEVLRRTGDL